MRPFSIEAAVISWLKSHGYEAAQLMQADRSGVFVTVERVGGGVVDFVDYPSLAVQVWADSNAQAEQAAEQLRLLLLIGQPPAGVYSFEVEAVYNFPDPDTDKARYQLVVNAVSQLVTE